MVVDKNNGVTTSKNKNRMVLPDVVTDTTTVTPDSSSIVGVNYKNVMDVTSLESHEHNSQENSLRTRSCNDFLSPHNTFHYKTSPVMTSSNITDKCYSGDEKEPHNYEYIFDKSRNKSMENNKKLQRQEEIEDDFAFELDSGFWGWLVVVGSFLCNGIIFGVINCYGILFDMIKDRFFPGSDGNNFWTASIGSFAVGMTFFCSFFASILTEVIGIRKTAILGGILATTGLLLSSFATSFIYVWLSYGLVFGVGASLAYTPSLVILGHYFERRLGIVNGVVTAGSSIFSVVLSISLDSLVKTCSYQHVMWILSGFMSLLIICGMTFIERRGHGSRRRQTIVIDDSGIKEDSFDSISPSKLSNLFRREMWSNRLYVIWIIAIPVGLFGYFVPYFTLVVYFKKVVPSLTSSLPITTMSVASGVGRVLFGIIADCQRVNRIFLQQIAFTSIGLLTVGLIFARDVYSLMISCIGLGLFDGCFITVLGPIAFDLVGREGASQAVGFLLALCSIPLTIGPMVAGFIVDHTESYSYAYLYAGIPPFVGAILMIPILKGIKCRAGVTNAGSSVCGSVPAGRTSFSSSEGDNHDDLESSKHHITCPVTGKSNGLRALHPSTQTSVTEIPGTPGSERDEAFFENPKNIAVGNLLDVDVEILGEKRNPHKKFFISNGSSSSQESSNVSLDDRQVNGDILDRRLQP